MKNRHHSTNDSTNDSTSTTARGAGPKLKPVRFEFTDPKATKVSVAGTFNGWHPTTKTLQPSGNGHWLKELALAPGTYEYCLVVDGQWMPDPQAKETVSNPFGGRNSVLKVADSPEATPATHLADAKNSPLKNANK